MTWRPVPRWPIRGRCRAAAGTGPTDGAWAVATAGRWRDRPAAALLTDIGVSLYDLRDRSWIGHVGLGAKAHDVAFAPRGELVIVSAHGTLVVRPTP
ncbi:hypothetical protein [Actinoallomurus iriomotensis]|uniref:Uncharacterized protein n=1 Tax=Actinoallomurus iriomotensis TaxID=478107 RepID=A0A9W6SCI9_9ACTN|nr:hypothetical protein [Actinoallomurus iriomotensis]GLY91111.1 hypothetical protein Airi02_090400 [Actinoallomurus iriomotensis]